MRQRVKMAQALVHDPELIVLDEPLSGMDPIVRRKTIRMIKEWGRQGKSIVVSSHILHEIEAMTANILLINQGRILAEGDVHQIRELIDEHPHTVHIRAERTRALAREFLAYDDVLSLKFEDDAVVVETGRPDFFYARLTELAASGAARRHPRGHLAGRQPSGGISVSGEVVTPGSTLERSRVCGRRPSASSICRSGRCCGRAAPSFSASSSGGPVVLAAALRLAEISRRACSPSTARGRRAPSSTE